MERPFGRYVTTVCAGAGLLAYLLLILIGGKQGGMPSQAWGQSAGSSGLVSTRENTVASWTGTSKEIAAMMIEKYGKPNYFTEESVVWYGNDPWKRTVVYRDGWQDQSSVMHPDVLEQVISYHVPRNCDPTLFDSRLVVDRTRNELKFRSDSERTNFLAINLANDIVTGGKSVEEARAFAAKTTRLSEAGKKSPYTEGFTFRVKNDMSPIQE